MGRSEFQSSKLEPNIIIDFLAEEIQADKLLKTLPRLSEEWSVQFKFKLTNGHTGLFFCCIFYMSSGFGANIYGGRVPAIYFNRNNRLLFIDSPVSGNWMYRTVIPTMIEYNTEYSVEIHQRYKSGGVYKYSILLNGEEIHSTDNTQAQQFYDVMVYAGNPIDHACVGTISDFKITNFL